MNNEMKNEETTGYKKGNGLFNRKAKIETTRN